MEPATPSDKPRPSTSSRAYIGEAIKAATHPVRGQILKCLREGPQTTTALETFTGRNRYDIYHHLNVLESVGLVAHRIVGGKAKEFRLLEARRPGAAVSLLGEEEIRQKPEAFQRLLDALEELEGREIPNKAKIAKAEIILSYARPRKE